MGTAVEERRLLAVIVCLFADSRNSFGQLCEQPLSNTLLVSFKFVKLVLSAYLSAPQLYSFFIKYLWGVGISDSKMEYRLLCPIHTWPYFLSKELAK